MVAVCTASCTAESGLFQGRSVVFTSPHPRLARFLQRTIVVLAIVGSARLWPASANADQLGVQRPGWDYRDPVNIAESRVYARLFFEFKDTGVKTPEFKSFRFTNPAPTGVMTTLYDAEVVFEKIYAHHLGNSTRTPACPIPSATSAVMTRLWRPPSGSTPRQASWQHPFPATPMCSSSTCRPSAMRSWETISLHSPARRILPLLMAVLNLSVLLQRRCP